MKHSVIFMGTPDFAVASLNALLDNNIDVKAVITSPDRPAGRGQKIAMSAVKEFALSKDIQVLQPTNLKDDAFIASLKDLNASLFVVVAFRMLPEIVWAMPELGTINLHGSLLPQYRGAAPINWAVINGEEQTGASTFFIEKEIDTGKIIDTVKIAIGPNDTAGIVHDKLMIQGAQLLAKSVQEIFEGKVNAIAQDNSTLTDLQKHAPKIFKPDCKIDWNNTSETIHNKIRGLSPYPTAWTEIVNDTQKKSLKLFHSEIVNDSKLEVGQVTVAENELFIGTNNGSIKIIELQLEGKKKMKTSDFLKGFKFEEWQIVNK
ncbi:methionyl-tRNA formyltransferase [Crocinitomix catalasitica]|uniref:methionyl-tRNA formyltransferase n=1 Tax=Crocinitomix catalasitica TaxID=184607 RepID=UPI000A5B7520|nr:methionyl-tRNA formyltransferase [Crocinitomix catalasitica]